MQEKLNTSENNTSLENVKQPKSVKDLRSMFEKNIKKYEIKKEVTAATAALHLDKI